MFVIHKNSRIPREDSYSGPTWDAARLRSRYKPQYESRDEALELAAQLTAFNPGVGFSVADLDEPGVMSN